MEKAIVTTGTSDGHGVATAPVERRWWALVLLALAEFVVVLDASVVNIALPTIHRGFFGAAAFVLLAIIPAATIGRVRQAQGTRRYTSSAIVQEPR